jgi:HPt (histidine-containing phosphotransfer) domain-containing protein
MPLTRILLVDAGADARALIAQAFPELDKEGAIRTASRSDAVARAEADRADVIVLAAPPGDAALAALLVSLAERQATARIPAIVLTEEAGGPTSGGGKLPEPAALADRIRRVFAEARQASQLAHLKEIGGVTFVQEMIGIFLESTPPRLQAARNGLAATDFGAMELAAHSIKSAAANLGGDELQELAGKIESLAAARQAAALTPLVHQLTDAFARLRDRLQRELD